MPGVITPSLGRWELDLPQTSARGKNVDFKEKLTHLTLTFNCDPINHKWKIICLLCPNNVPGFFILA